MLSKDKIRMMAALAVYEKNGGAEALKTAGHYRYDYVMTQLFSAFIRFSICFAVCLGFYLFLHSADFFNSINTKGFIETSKGIGIIYISGLAVYLLIAVIVYSGRHSKACRSSELYAAGLSRLVKRFDAKRDSFL